MLKWYFNQYLFLHFNDFQVVSSRLYFLLSRHNEGGLATYRSAMVQNRNLAALAQVFKSIYFIIIMSIIITIDYLSRILVSNIGFSLLMVQIFVMNPTSVMLWQTRLKH